MKRAKPSVFDPFSAMSYHDLNQGAHRLRRANRKLRRAIRRLSEEEGDSAEFILSNAPAEAQALAWRRTREHPANRAANRHGLPAGTTGPIRDGRQCRRTV